MRWGRRLDFGRRVRSAAQWLSVRGQGEGLAPPPVRSIGPPQCPPFFSKIVGYFRNNHGPLQASLPHPFFSTLRHWGCKLLHGESIFAAHAMRIQRIVQYLVVVGVYDGKSLVFMKIHASYRRSSNWYCLIKINYYRPTSARAARPTVDLHK